MKQTRQYVCEYCGDIFYKRRKYSSNYCSFQCYVKAREKAYKEKFINRFGNAFDFISLKDGYVIYECKECKTIRKTKAKQIFFKGAVCSVCASRERQYIQSIKDLIKGLKKVVAYKERQQRKVELQRLKEERQAKTYKHICIECGKVFESKSKSSLYCCRSHKRKKSNKRNELKREHRLNNNGRIDKDITLERLIKRDNNICYLCGKECNADDYKIINGAFVVGKYYPSIEHIKPLSKGGTHTWDNIKLSHISCNSKKYNNMPPSKN